MTHEQFAALVSRLEDRARRNPGSYKRRVLMLAFAAHAYLGFVLLALVLLALAALAIGARVPGLALKLVALIVALIWLVLRAMRVRLIPPQGRALNREGSARTVCRDRFPASQA
jgi:hypothetical protein